MRLAALAALAASLVAGSASAQTIQHPCASESVQERGLKALQQRAHLRRGPRPPPPPQVMLDFVHTAQDITLDPATGVVTTTFDVQAKTVGTPLTSIGMFYDVGLKTTVATSSGRTVTVNEGPFPGGENVWAVGQFEVSPPAPAGETITIRITLSGTLKCGAFPGSGAACGVNKPFSHFANGSIFPTLFDPERPYMFDTVTREVTLRTPAGSKVVMSGDRVSETVEGQTNVFKTSIPQPYPHYLPFYAFVGGIGTYSIKDVESGTSLFFPTPEKPMDAKLAGWSTSVLKYVGGMAGMPFGFTSLNLIRLPREMNDPGTVSYGMTLLSETYATPGDVMHEEVWAHENAHLFWAVLVPEGDFDRSRMLTEGLATLTEIDYTHAHHFASEDRDLYYARRFRAVDVELRYARKGLPPIVLKPGQQQPDGMAYTTWAYEKTSSTLDHLRAGIGDEVFAAGIKDFAAKCRYVGCVADDLRQAMERASKQDLKPFFARWITGTATPTITVSFAPTASGADVTLEQEDALAVPLDVWIRMDDGSITRKKVRLEGTTLTFSVDGKVRSVSLSPRHALHVNARSAVDMDLDFDGEVDGHDLFRCLPLVGKSARNTIGIYDMNETFDAACDIDQNGTIDDADIAAIQEPFGTLRAR